MYNFAVSAPSRPGVLPAWVRALPDAHIVAGVPGDVTAVCYDSRRCTPGCLFAAVPGFRVDGHDFLAAAVAAGARALLVQLDRRSRWGDVALPEGVALVAVPDVRAALARAAAAFFGFPARRLAVFGVTGTDGKTTTCHLLAHVLTACGRTAGLLSSVELRSGGVGTLNASHMTTLEAPEVQSALADMVRGGDRCAVVEASSHGLALHRVDGCEFDVGVFTNLTRDHLDFHGTMDGYREAKARLFRMLSEGTTKKVARAAVLNADDPSWEYMRAAAGAVPAVTYALGAAADLRAERVRAAGLQTRFVVRGLGVQREAVVPLAGRHNVANCLAAVAAATAQDVALDAAVDALATFPGVPGRMEAIDEGQRFAVVVDIASTEQALRNVLAILRPLTTGRLWAVFGCAGERDVARREGMGRVAAEMVDFAVLTNEDPRSEDPEAIIDDIARALRAGGRREGDDFARVPDRRAALRFAFERARPGDTVLLAGKGTEQSIVVGSEHIPWDERAAAREVLRDLGYGKA